MRVAGKDALSASPPHPTRASAHAHTRTRTRARAHAHALGRAGTTLIERFSDCEWSLGGLGSNGWVYGAGLGGKRVGGMSGFGAGDEARV